MVNRREPGFFIDRTERMRLVYCVERVKYSVSSWNSFTHW